MIILDANIVSEIWRPRANPSVLSWLDQQERQALYLCTPALAELHYGADRLPAGRRKDVLKASIAELESDLYRDRILAFDVAAAVRFGHVGALREKMGRRIEPMNAMIAAIALSRDMSLATRDVGDFAGIGLDLINPFDFTQS